MKFTETNPLQFVYSHYPLLLPADDTARVEEDSYMLAIRTSLESMIEKAADDYFLPISWRDPLDAIVNSLRVLDKLKRKDFIDFLKKSFAKNPSKDSVAFINTVSTWIQLMESVVIASTDDESHTRFKVGNGHIYVDVTSVPQLSNKDLD
jgi:hypothetical protein